MLPNMISRTGSVRIFLVVVIAVGLAWYFVGNSVSEIVQVVEEEKLEDYFLSTSTLPVFVSGVIESTDRAIIYAQTAGTVEKLLVSEGTVVPADSLLLKQSTPAQNANTQLLAEQVELTRLQQAVGIETTSNFSNQAVVRAYDAKEISTIRKASNDNRLKEAKSDLLTTLDTNLLTAINAINFTNTHRSIYSAEGLRLYEQLVVDLYGQAPNYFQGGIMNNKKSPDDLVAVLNHLKKDEGVSVIDVQNLAVLVQTQLENLSYLFSTAEADIFDRKSTVVIDELRNEYLTLRTDILKSLKSSQVSEQNLQSTIDNILTDSLGKNTNIKLTEFDKKSAANQATLAKLIAEQAVSVAQAGRGVAVAQQALGSLKSPFAGVVDKVQVKAGEYVLPGTPLLSLAGTGGYELTVNVPVVLLSQIAVGQPFVQKGETIGYVDRFSPIVQGGSAAVIISLLDNPALFAGSSLAGEIIGVARDDIYAIKRSYVHFDNQGAYVLYQDNSLSRVNIIYDTGQLLFVGVARVDSKPLIPSVSFNL